MNCRYVQSRLSAYLDFELSGDEQQQIRSHLEECIECSCEFESLRRTKQLIRQLPVVKPHGCPEQILLRIRQSQPMPPRRAFKIRWRAPRLWQYAGGLALAAGIVLWERAHTPDNTPTTNLTTTYTTPAATPLLPAVAPELSTVYRPFLQVPSRRPSYLIYEHSLTPSVSYPVNQTTGYQPISHWNGIFESLKPNKTSQ